jgi:hypothetical protein
MTDPSPCPHCNSWQDFPTKLRRLDTKPWKEVYIRCSMCGYELVLGHTTDEIEMLRMRAKGVRERLQYEMSRHGLPTQTTLTHANKLAERMKEAVVRLERDMEAINGRH